MSVAPPPFGLTPQGWNSKRLVDIFTDLQNAMIAQFGDVNLDPQSVFGQLTGVMAKAYADVWENMGAVYSSQYPNSAEGISLDNVVQFNGLSRNPATQTSVFGVCTGSEGTLIPIDSIAAISSISQNFVSTADRTISASTAYSLLISVSDVTTQAYVVQVNGFNFVYSLPIVTFTGSFVTGNQIVTTINGFTYPAVNFITDNDTTLAALAAQMATDPSIASATPSGGNTITIVPNSGFQTIISLILITGGDSQPTYAITYAAPGSSDGIVDGLVAIINATSGDPAETIEPITASNSSGSLQLVANDIATSFNGSVGENLSIDVRSTSVPFVALTYGPIPCPIGALDTILTPISGWSSITNPIAGITGTNVETDAQLRLRRLQSLSLQGNATVEAIRSKLLQVLGVTSAFVYDNPTAFQTDILITLSGPLVTDNEITITWLGTALDTIDFTTDNATTMSLIAAQIGQQPQVSSCAVTGDSSNGLDIAFNQFYDVPFVPDDFQILMGASQPQVTVSGGIPPKSFEAVVEGGSNLDIATAIWLSKPAGIQTFGNTQQNIIDSMGTTQPIFFSRPTPIYIWVSVSITLYAKETFPAGGLLSVAQAILAYGQTLGVGQDVILQRVNAQIFEVPGIDSGDMELAGMTLATINPSFSAADIPIAATSISVWDISRINVTEA